MRLPFILTLIFGLSLASNEFERKTLKDYIKFDEIQQNLRAFSSDPHIGGTEENLKVAEKIKEKFETAGLENVHFRKYTVLLSYPNFTNPNHARIYDQNGNKLFESKGISPALIPEEQSNPIGQIQWLAYSANGLVIGDPVYCHYGRPEDFVFLKQNGVSLNGKIALIRYGGAFRGDTIHNAGIRGAVGVILFSDPADVAGDGTDTNHVYPNADWMPAESVQRGTAKKGDGDPLSPFFPAKPELYFSRTVEDLKNEHIIPSIPAIPLGYGDVYRIISQMGGKAVPKEWQGGLNVTYNFGPGLVNNQKLEIEVHSTIEKREIQNVIGYLKGSKEADRYVILSNHFDAWAYGSMDPNSGTAIMAEVARAMKQAQNDGVFKPLRSVMFCAWDAEEYGLMGSNEFAEEFAHMISQRAVALLNVDLISGNATLKLEAVPTLYNLVIDAAKAIDTPLDAEKSAGRNTIYDTWYHRMPGNNPIFPNLPVIGAPNDGSDHATYMSYLGLPVLDFTYLRHNDNPLTNRTYPLYHTLYETPFTNEHLFDTNNFAVHKAVGQFWAEMARLITEQPVLPLNVATFANQLLHVYLPSLKSDMKQLANKITEAALAFQQVGFLLVDAKNFVANANRFQSQINQLDPTTLTDLQIRDINDRIMLAERCFIVPTGMPNAPTHRNVLFSFANNNAYAASIMPGIYDTITALEQAEDEADRLKLGGELAEQVSHLQYAVQCATSTLLSDP